jgi:hypothetical protein
VLSKVRDLVLPSIVAQGRPIEAWIVDDTGFAKKGAHSVGVARQYCAVRLLSASEDFKLAEPNDMEWLLVEWPEGEAEPAKYWFSTLSDDTPLETLDDITKLRCGSISTRHGDSQDSVPGAAGTVCGGMRRQGGGVARIAFNAAIVSGSARTGMARFEPPPMVHPRVGGGDHSRALPDGAGAGPSPRGRGRRRC